jgi:hypothetical protein
MPARAWILRFVLVTAIACGGRTLGDELDGGATDGSTSPTDAGGSDSARSPNDGAIILPPDTGPTPPQCNHKGGGASGGPGFCEIDDEEVCDGITYQVHCACPSARCTCSGSSGGVVTFDGCPACPTAANAYAACGYPH